MLMECLICLIHVPPYFESFIQGGLNRYLDPSLSGLPSDWLPTDVYTKTFIMRAVSLYLLGLLMPLIRLLSGLRVLFWRSVFMTPHGTFILSLTKLPYDSILLLKEVLDRWRTAIILPMAAIAVGIIAYILRNVETLVCVTMPDEVACEPMSYTAAFWTVSTAVTSIGFGSGSPYRPFSATGKAVLAAGSMAYLLLVVLALLYLMRWLRLKPTEALVVDLLAKQANREATRLAAVDIVFAYWRFRRAQVHSMTWNKGIGMHPRPEWMDRIAFHLGFNTGGHAATEGTGPSLRSPAGMSSPTAFGKFSLLSPANVKSHTARGDNNNSAGGTGAPKAFTFDEALASARSSAASGNTAPSPPAAVQGPSSIMRWCGAVFLCCTCKRAPVTQVSPSPARITPKPKPVFIRSRLAHANEGILVSTRTLNIHGTNSPPMVSSDSKKGASTAGIMTTPRDNSLPKRLGLHSNASVNGNATPKDRRTLLKGIPIPGGGSPMAPPPLSARSPGEEGTLPGALSSRETVGAGFTVGKRPPLGLPNTSLRAVGASVGSVNSSNTTVRDGSTGRDSNTSGSRRNTLTTISSSSAITDIVDTSSTRQSPITTAPSRSSNANEPGSKTLPRLMSRPPALMIEGLSPPHMQFLPPPIKAVGSVPKMAGRRNSVTGYEGTATHTHKPIAVLASSEGQGIAFSPPKPHVLFPSKGQPLPLPASPPPPAEHTEAAFLDAPAPTHHRRASTGSAIPRVKPLKTEQQEPVGEQSSALLAAVLAGRMRQQDEAAQSLRRRQKASVATAEGLPDAGPSPPPQKAVSRVPKSLQVALAHHTAQSSLMSPAGAAVSLAAVVRANTSFRISAHPDEDNKYGHDLPSTCLGWLTYLFCSLACRRRSVGNTTAFFRKHCAPRLRVVARPLSLRVKPEQAALKAVVTWKRVKRERMRVYLDVDGANAKVVHTTVLSVQVEQLKAKVDKILTSMVPAPTAEVMRENIKHRGFKSTAKDRRKAGFLAKLGTKRRKSIIGDGRSMLSPTGSMGGKSTIPSRDETGLVAWFSPLVP
jgi:hypothetical protein